MATAPVACSCTGHTPSAESFPIEDKIVKYLKPICLIALTAFSCYVAPQVFATALFTGLVIGVISGKRVASQCQQQGTTRHGTACSQNLMGELTGLHFTPIISLLFDVVITAAHIEHHAIFPPINGFIAGVRLAKFVRV